MDDLALLPKEVRKAFRKMDRDCPYGYEVAQEWQTIRAELLRLAAECDRLFDAKNILEVARKVDADRAERAESELAEVKRRIAEAPVAELRCRDATWILWPSKNCRVGEAIGKHVAVVPLDGAEAKG